MLNKILSLIEEYSEWNSRQIDFSRICMHLKELSGAQYVIFNKYLLEKNISKTIGYAGVPGHIEQFSKLFGFDILNQEWEIDEMAKKTIMSNKLVNHGCIEEIYPKHIPGALTKTIKSVFKIGNVYSIGILRNEQPFGSIMLVAEKDKAITNVEELKILAGFLGTLIKRIKSEEALFETQKKLELIAQHSKDILVIVDSNYRINYINKVVPDFEEEIINTSVLRFVHPESREIYKGCINSALAGVEVKQEIKGATFNNGFSCYMVTFCPIELDGEKKVYITAQDISDEKQNLRALKESEENLIRTNSVARVGYWQLDIVTMKYTGSDFLKQMLELEGNDFDAAQLINLINVENRTQLKQLHSNAITKGENYQLTTLAQTAKGRPIWLKSIAEVEAKNGKPIKLKGVLLDITDHYLMLGEQKQISSELFQFQEVLNKSSLISYTDLKGNILYVNENFCQLSQYSVKELVGSKHNIVNSGYHSREFWKKMWSTVAKGNVWRAEVCNKAKDGTLYWVDTFITAIKDNNGKPFIYYSVRNDISERKKIEEKLEREKNRLEGILEATNVGTWEWNIQTGETVFNERWFEMIGYSSADFPKADVNTWMNFVHPEDFKKSDVLMTKCLAGEIEFYECEYRMKHKNANWIWIKNRGRVITWTENNVPLFMYGTHTDITEEKESSKLLLQTLDDLYDTQQIAQIGRWELDLSKGDFFFSQSIYDVFVLDSNEFETSYSGLMSIIHPDDRTQAIAVYIRAVKEQLPIDQVHRLLLKDRVVWVSLKGKAEYNADGTPTRVIGTIQDITTIKNAEDAIRIQAEQQKLISEVSSNLISVSLENYDNKINATIQHVAQFYNVNRAYVYKLSDDKLNLINTNKWCGHDIIVSGTECPPYLSLETYDWLLKKVVADSYFKLEDVNEIPKSKKDILAELNRQGIKSLLVAPLKNEEEQMIGFIGISSTTKVRHWTGEEVELFKLLATVISDTEIKKSLEEESLLAKNEAIAANKTKSEFLANMSHEIRTPLNAIIGYSELLKDKIQDSDLRSYVKGIVLGGNNLLALINDILDLSKIEANHLIVNQQPVSIYYLLTELEEIFYSTAESKKINFSINYLSPQITHIISDEVRLRQILFNLIGNALKFTAGGGTVKVDACCLKNEGTDSYTLVIKVSDTGIGIAPDQFNKIFEAFKQQDGQSSRKYGGTGLGLTITNRLTTLMGGTISLASELNKGSEFVVKFNPIKVPTENEISQLEPEVLSNKEFYFEKQKVLIVEDNELNRIMLSEILKLYNLDTCIVESGKKALEHLAINEVDIILLDIMMPEMDGYETLMNIRKIDKYKLLPIVAVTASGLITKTDGFNALIKKPITRKELLETVNQLLHPKEASDDGIEEVNTVFKLNTEQFTFLKEKLAKAKRTKSVDDIAHLSDSIISLAIGNNALIKYSQKLKRCSENFEIDEMNYMIDKLELIA